MLSFSQLLPSSGQDLELWSSHSCLLPHWNDWSRNLFWKQHCIFGTISSVFPDFWHDFSSLAHGQLKHWLLHRSYHKIQQEYLESLLKQKEFTSNLTPSANCPLNLSSSRWKTINLIINIIIIYYAMLKLLAYWKFQLNIT